MNKKIIFTALLLFALPFLTMASHPANTGWEHQNEKGLTVSDNSSVGIGSELIESGNASVGDSNNDASNSSSPMQNKEIMDGIGRNKEKLKEIKNKLYGTSTGEVAGGIGKNKNELILKDMLSTDIGTGGIGLRKEVIDALRSGKRGEDLLKIIRNESDRLKNKSLNFKAEIDSNREKLKKTLDSKVTDVKKIEVGLALSDNFNSLNGKITDRYFEILNKLENSLNSLSSKTDLLEKNGKDVSAIKKTLADNKESIEVVRLAVKTQAQKTYSANIESGKTLRQDFGSVRTNLSNDLKNLEGAIKIVKSAIINSAQMLIVQ